MWQPDGLPLVGIVIGSLLKDKPDGYRVKLMCCKYHEMRTGLTTKD